MSRPSLTGLLDGQDLKGPARRTAQQVAATVADARKGALIGPAGWFFEV